MTSRPITHRMQQGWDLDSAEPCRDKGLFRLVPFNPYEWSCYCRFAFGSLNKQLIYRDLFDAFAYDINAGGSCTDYTGSAGRLFRYVPPCSVQVHGFWESYEALAAIPQPTDPTFAGLADKIHDVLDLHELVVQACYWVWEQTQGSLTVLSLAWQNTLALVQFLMLALIIGSASRQRLRGSPLMKPVRMLCWGLLLPVCVMARPGDANGHRANAAGSAGPMSREAEMEEWRAGLLTMREQMIHAANRAIWELPLQHSSGEAPLPVYTTNSYELEDVEEDQEADGAEIHITLWLATPYFEAETVDLQMRLPLTVGAVQEALQESTRNTPAFVDKMIPTEPQVHDLYASFVGVISGVELSDKVTLLIDARSLDGTVYAVYHTGPVTRHSMLQHLPYEQTLAVDVYAFGRRDPLEDGFSIQAVQGGLVKMMPLGQHCRWSDTLEHRLRAPNRWNPNVEPPGCLPGEHDVFQTNMDQCLYERLAADDRPPDVVAEELFNIEFEAAWTVTPHPPVRLLAYCGHRIHSQIAVLEWDQHPLLETTVIFLDLRGLALFPQWLALDGNIFNPTTYLDGLQSRTPDGWTNVVQGGEPIEPGTMVRVRHGEVITIYMQRTEVVTSAESEGPDSSDSDDDSDDQTGHESDTDSILHSSELSDPPDDGIIRGPPPPIPMDRSRSPRRRSTTNKCEDKEATSAILPVCDSDEKPLSSMSEATADGQAEARSELKLANIVGVTKYDLTYETVPLPHSNEELRTVFWPWPSQWLCCNTARCKLHSATIMQLEQSVHWSQLIGKEGLTVSVYTDGSYLSTTATSGYGVVAILQWQKLEATFAVIGEQIRGNPTSPWKLAEMPALEAEQIAIAVALLWIGQMTSIFGLVDVTLHYDCMAAGKGADGQWNACNHFCQKLHGLELYVRHLCQYRLKLSHVKAHAGSAWNEMVDRLAKYAAAGQRGLTAAPDLNCQAFLAMDWAWAAAMAYASSHSALPIQAGKWLAWKVHAKQNGSPLTPQQLIPVLGTHSNSTTTGREIKFKAITLNVQGLKGKHGYISAQIKKAGCNILCLQETKDKEGTIATNDFLRFATDSKSHWGVAIWINRHEGLFTVDDKPFMIAEEDTHTLRSTERLLMIEIRKDNLKGLVFSGHCPHQARATERDAFLEELCGLLRQHIKDTFIIGGLDLNGRPELEVAGTTGDLPCGDTDITGRIAAQMFQECGLWLPATFQDFHVGPSETFCHPQGTKHRIDFVAIGGKFRTTAVKSEIAADIDNGNINEDHSAVQLEVVGTVDVPGGEPRLWKPRYDRAKMMTAEGKEIIRHGLEAFPQPSWETHVDSHYQRFLDYSHDLLQRHFGVPHDGPRAAYIPEKTWRLRQQKLRFKKIVGHRRRLWRDLLGRAFKQWSSQSEEDLEPVIARQGLLYQLAATGIGWATASIKHGIRVGKAAYLQGLVKDGAQGIHNILQRVKKVGFGGRRGRTISRPLPKLLRPDGEPVRSRSDRDLLWLEHFGEQEHAVIHRTNDYLQTITFKDHDLDQMQWDLSGFPNIMEIEDAIRATQKNKAAGIDAIPNEYLKAMPSSAALVLHPLVMKSMMCMTQPLHWRGGILYSAWKQSGSTASPSSYRSLFVSSAVGKLFHKTLRTKSQDQFQRILHSLHLGSKTRAPLAFATLYMTSHFRRHKRTGRPAAALFLDTKSAYYRVIRQTVMGDLRDDNNIRHLFSRFGLTDDDMADLLSLIERGGAMKEAGVHPMIQGAVRDVYRHTWCVSMNTTGKWLMEAKAGSRPGESWADAVFSFIYSRVLSKIAMVAEAEDLFSWAPWDVEVGILGEGTEGPDALLRDATWADDSTFPIDADTSAILLRKARRLAEVVIITCKSYGMQPNLGRGKTELLISLVGKGTQKARVQFFGHGRSSLILPDIEQELHVAPQYTHLGGVLDHKLTWQPEARKRLALANGAYDNGKTLLFQNKQLPLETRVGLFEITVLPTIFNLAIWVTGCDAWQRLSNGYSRILRRLFATKQIGEDLFRIPLPCVHMATNSWTLELHAVRARLGVLSALALEGPEPLWAMIQAEKTWAEQVRKDLLDLQQSIKDWPGLAPTAWPTWCGWIRENPARFKKAVKKMLQARHVKEMNMQQTRIGLWALAKQCQLQRPHLLLRCLWRCRACSKSFLTKAAIGAHLFKTHNRMATYRCYLDGSVCTACGRQYWSYPRLAAHLRSSKVCVAALSSTGCRKANVPAGFGSRAWRQMEVDQFNPAAPVAIDMDKIPVAESQWPDEVKTAHRDICHVLQRQRQWTDKDTVSQLVVDTLAKHPLFPQEETDLIAFIRQEIEDLQQANQDEPWEADTFSFLSDLLEARNAEQWLHTVDVGIKARAPTADTFLDFETMVDNFDWGDAVQTFGRQSETHEEVLEILDKAWDAGTPLFSGTSELPAAVFDPISFVPPRLRQLWDRVVQGDSFTVQADESFWASPWSVPFRALRASCKPIS